jgi:MtN3 and saliva related transmembrane protein
MNDLWPTLVGLAAAFGTTAAWFPQVARPLRTRSARDFSWHYLRLFAGGVFLWMVYGVLRRDWLIAATNLFILILVGVVAWVKFRSE